MCEQENPPKTPQTVDTIESFSDQILKVSLLMKFDEFDSCYGAANKARFKKWQRFEQHLLQKEILISLLKFSLQL